MAEAKECPLEKLRELYVVQGLTAFSIAKYHLFVHNNTVAKWILIHRLDDERKRFLEEATERLKQQKTNIQDAEYEVIDDANIAEQGQRGNLSLTQPSLPLLPLNGAVPAPYLAQEDEDNTAFNRLSRYKQKFVLVYVDNQKTCSQRQIAEMCGISEDTVTANLKDADVREAILDLVRAEFKFKGELSLLNRIQQLEDENKDRPDDRKLKADILGLINNNRNININLGYGGSTDKRIKGF